MYQKYPKVGTVSINDEFWSPYLKNVQEIMLPYVFRKLEENDFVANYIALAEKSEKTHLGPAYTDGLLLEAVRGTCDFLAANPDAKLEEYVDSLISLIVAAQAEDGFSATCTIQNRPHQRWGENDGDIVVQHDLYNHGCLIEAGISHYNATKKTTLLKAAVKAANLIVNTMGKAPKKNIVPGHSLVEEAFVKLYRLFREEEALADFARENNIHCQDYLDIAEFWYDARGNPENRFLCKFFPPSYNQDHITFAKQTEAVGHSVRAMLCYLGATVVAQEKGRTDYFRALTQLWDNVVYKKLHISGGIGARHDIEGFDIDYNLPNKAYLETCAAIGLAFWNTEMNLVYQDSKYFDCFERSLYNNILSAVGGDFQHFFYQNPLESDGQLRRWEWHICPCCPPMLLKIFSALHSYIYSYDDTSVNVNLLIGSSYANEFFEIRQSGNEISVDSKGKRLTLRVRVPEYVENFTMSKEYRVENGYAVVTDVWNSDEPLTLHYDTPIRRIFCNPKVQENHGKVAVARGPYILCVEGFDNGGNVDIEISQNPKLTANGENVLGKTAQNTEFVMIPYYKWCNRGEEDADSKMAVWLKQENMPALSQLADQIGEKLYGIYQ